MSGRSTKSTPAIGRSSMRRKSHVGKQAKKAPQSLQGLRQNNRELAMRVEELEQSLQRAQARNVDLQAEKVSINEESVLKSKEIAQLRAQLMEERRGAAQLVSSMAIIKQAVQNCDFVNAISEVHGDTKRTPFSRPMTVNSPSPMVKGAPSASDQGSSGSKAYEIRATREEFNVPTLSQTPIAHKPTAENIAEEQEQFESPLDESRCVSATCPLSDVRHSGSSSYLSQALCSPALATVSASHHVEEDECEPIDSSTGVRGDEVALSSPSSSTLPCSPPDHTSAVSDPMETDSSYARPVSQSENDSSSAIPPSDSSLSDAVQHFYSFPDDILSESANKPAGDETRLKRRRSVSSYKEPGLNHKLRSGDPFTEPSLNCDGTAFYGGIKKRSSKKRRQSCYNSFPSLADDKENVSIVDSLAIAPAELP